MFLEYDLRTDVTCFVNPIKNTCENTCFKNIYRCKKKIVHYEMTFGLFTIVILWYSTNFLLLCLWLGLGAYYQVKVDQFNNGKPLPKSHITIRSTTITPEST
jgi:hypothetical protein